MKPLLEVRGLEKHFGSTRALSGASMSILPGQISGLLGPNASGKTTLLKTMAGLLRPAAGEVIFPNGASAGAEARGRVSFCPDGMIFPRWMSVKDAFAFYRAMYPDYSQARADELIRILDLTDCAGSRAGKLSKGMKERLVLALTLSRETALYLLDEPLDGIDPVGKAKIIDAILTLKPENAAILVSTHLVKDIERIFDSVFFISGGKVVFSGGCDTIREENGKTIEQKYLEVFTHG
jgi:ABC-2 type transport system ATP-binding protein